MTKCQCSTRALSILLKDLAGLDIRRQIPRAPQISRSTRPPAFRRYSTQVSQQTPVEDDFLPWEEKEHGLEVDGDKRRGAKVPEVDEKWEAEVDVLSAANEALESDEGDSHRISAEEVTTFSPSRKQSRNLRKLRRIEAGTFKNSEKRKSKHESAKYKDRERYVLKFPAISRHHIPVSLYTFASLEREREAQEKRNRGRYLLRFPAISQHHVPASLYQPASWERKMVRELREDFEKEAMKKRRKAKQLRMVLALPAISQHMESYSKPWEWEERALRYLTRLKMKNGLMTKEGEEHDVVSQEAAKEKILKLYQILERVEMPEGPWIPVKEVKKSKAKAANTKGKVPAKKKDGESLTKKSTKARKPNDVADELIEAELVENEVVEEKPTRKRHIKKQSANNPVLARSRQEASEIEENEDWQTRKARTGPREPRELKQKGERHIDKATSKSQEPRVFKPRENWQVQKAALGRKFGEQSWQPRKRVSPDTLEGIRALHASDPATYNTETLANHFQITSEAIRRILKSKWKPKTEEIEERTKRWEKRGVKKWAEMSAQGIKPPKKWREMGLENPDLHRKKTREARERAQGKTSWEDVRAMAHRMPMEAENSLADRLM